MESTISIIFDYPANYEATDLPPQWLRRFVYDTQNVDNGLIVNSALSINKSVYTATDYHSLKELLARMISAYNHNILFKKKP